MHMGFLQSAETNLLPKDALKSVSEVLSNDKFP